VPNISISNKLSSLSTRLRGSTTPIFSPAILFAAGEQGAWFDDDPATKFLDPAGTTLAGLTQSVLLELDKSRGLELGAEEFVAASANTASGVFRDGNNNDFTFTNAAINNSAIAYNAGFEANAGKFYEVTFEVYDYVSGTIRTRMQGTDGPNVTGNGFYKQVHLAISSGNFIGIANGTSGTTLKIRNISVRELPGNHATQGTTTFRPTRQTDGIQYDGSDDRQTTPYRPTLAGSIIARFNGATASRVVLGSQAATDGRAFLGLDASGRLAAGIGAQGTAAIVDPATVVGPELVTNGTFDVDANWSKGAGETISGGTLNFSGSATNVTQNAVAVPPRGKFVLVEYTISSITSGLVQIFFQQTSPSVVTVFAVQGNSLGLKRGLVEVPPNAASFGFNTSNFVGSIDNITVREVEINDLRNAWHTGAVTWDGTTVKLYLDGAEVYSAAQDGAVNTTVDMFKGALNANGTAAGFWQGRIEHAIALDRVLTPAEITNITAFWS
jgi:hypothetical protein